MENVQLQLQTGFIDRLADNDVVTQRVSDGYFNATAMCRASGKLIGHYLSNSATKAFLAELSSDIGVSAGSTWWSAAVTRNLGASTSGN